MRELFGRENYEYYARLTGRILKVEVRQTAECVLACNVSPGQDEWIFFTYPLDYLGVRSDLDIDCRPNFRSSHHELEATTGSLEMIPENCPLDPSGRLSISLDTEHCMSSLPSGAGPEVMVGLRSSTLDTRRARGGASSEAQSAVCLPQVHQKQTERMRARSDWFLSDWPRAGSGNTGNLVTYRAVTRDRVLSPRPTSLVSHVSTPTKLPLTGSVDLVTGKPPDGQVALRRKLSDKDKERREKERLVRRSSSKRKDKENGGGDQAASQVSLSRAGRAGGDC